MDVYSVIRRGYALMLTDLPLPPAGDDASTGPAAAIVSTMGKALDAGARTGWVDTARLAVVGHSYGGYMVNLLVTRTNRFVENSPVFGVAEANTPLLLIHGGRDQRVHVSQSEEFFRALAQQERIVELVRYHDAGHAGGSFSSAWWSRALDWFDEHLRAIR